MGLTSFQGTSRTTFNDPQVLSQSPTTVGPIVCKQESLWAIWNPRARRICFFGSGQVTQVPGVPKLLNPHSLGLLGSKPAGTPMQ